MDAYVVVFLLIALIAGVIGFGVVAGASAMIAKLLLITFLLLAFGSLLYRKRT